MKRLILAAISVFLFSAPALGYDTTLSPAEDTFTDSLYIDEEMGNTHFTRLWAGPVINQQAAQELLADGTPTPSNIPGIDGTEVTHSYLKFDLSAVNTPVSEAKLWLYRSPDEWGYSSIPGNGNPDLCPPPTYQNNTDYEYDRDGTHWYKFNDPDEGTIKVYYETNNGWSETTLKWKNEDSGPNFHDNTEGVTTQVGPAEGWYYPNNQGWVSWDVTDFVQQARGGPITLVLANDSRPYQTFHIFYSSESEPGTEALRPYLSINYVHPTISSTTYNHSTRRLTIAFSEAIQVATLQANIGNLSIEDQYGTSTNLAGATVITTQNSSTMEIELTVAQGNALNAIKENSLYLVVPLSNGILNFYGAEVSANSYPITNTAITGTLLDAKSSSVIANATVGIYDAAGNLKVQTTSDTDGNFTINANIPSGNYNLVITKSPLFKQKTQPITIVAGTPTDAGTLLIDPYGIVYDAVTGSPISGATVTLYTASGNIYTGCPEPNPQSSRADGAYNFNVAPGTYYLASTKEGYANYTGVTFTVTTEIVEWNIPMVPNNQASSTFLTIAKQANKKVVSAGDIITYTIDVTNLSSAFNATNITINDTLPAGFKYISNSTFVDGAQSADPTGTRNLSWSLGTLNTQATKKLTYRVRVGVDAKIGANANNAGISAIVNGTPASAGPSAATVEVKEGLFSDSGLLIGKVFEDINGNGIQDNYEPGIPNVSLILEDGTVIVTDEFGRYSVPNIKKGSHVVRLDQRVLPGGPFVKAKKAEPQKPAEKSTLLPTRETIIDRLRLDTWRKGVLGQNQAQVEAPAETQVAQEVPVVPPAPKIEKKVPPLEPTEQARQAHAYYYTAKDKNWQSVMGMLEATSEAEVAEILHSRDLNVIFIEREKADEGNTEAAGTGEKEEVKTVSPRIPPRAELLNKYPNPEVKKDKPRGEYRSDIPKESKFFKIYGSEIAKVNFPIKFLSEEEAKKEEEKDKAKDQFMLVGLADGTIGYLKGHGTLSNLESEANAPYKAGIYEDGKIKLYLKGLVKGEYLLTAAVDTDKEKGRHLFEYVNPEKYYPIYGDQSSYFNETQTNGKFYVRIDKDDSYGLWGNYNTQEFTQTEFSRYNRTIAGAKSHIELNDWVKDESSLPFKNSTLDFFYALSQQEQVSEVLSAKGISGPFWLGKTPLLEYSESIRIETRDKDRSDVVLFTKTLTRETDYEVDYDSGRIFFKEPISTRDENDDPNYIVVDYEYVPLSGENKYYLTGTRLATKLFDDKVSLAGQFIAENHVLNNPRLYGFDTVFQPDPDTRLAAEWGYSDRYLDSDNNTFLKQDNAWKVEAAKVLGKLKLQGYYSDIGNRFRNPVNVTEKGIEKYGATADYQLSEATNLVLDLWRNLSTISQTFDRQSSVDIYHKKENYFLGAGYAFQEYEDKLGLTPDKNINAINLQAGRKLSERLVASIEEEYEDEKQSGGVAPLDNKTYTTTGRLDYRVSQDATVYVKNRFIKELHKQYQNISSLGFSRATADGDAYVEYGFGGKTAETVFGLKKDQNINERLTLSSYMNNCVSSDKNEENVGFGTSYEIMDGLFTKFNFENTRAKNSDSSYYKQNAQSVAFDYLPGGKEHSYGIKFERRRASATREFNLLGYGLYRINKELNLIFNSEYLTERSSEDTVRTNRRAVLGLAFRPIFNDKLNFLSKYEYNDELNHSTSSSSTDYYNNIFSWEANYQLNPKTELFGKYALKFQRERDNGLTTDSLIDMVTTKMTYKLTEIFDIAGYYRLINEQDSCVRKQAPALELGTLLFKRVRFGLGYNFLDYEDRDSSDDDYSGIGPYFNLAAQF